MFLLKTNALSKILIFLAAYGLSACSTQKNTVITRTYHNITSKYNVLFNGSESFKKGQRSILERHKNDYSRLLPVFLYEDKQLTGTVSPDMDRTIKKAEKLINLHSITVKPETKSNKPLSEKRRRFLSKKEYNSWVDNSYLLMGKAQFYKHEYDKSKETFLFIINEYKDKNTIYETRIWLARTYNELGEFKNSEEILKQLENDEELPGKLNSLLFSTIADYHIKNEELKPAVPYVEKALKYEKKKKLRIRYTFLLAQLSERTGQLKKASDYYNKVIKMNPPYEMTFNARISRALAYEKGFGSIKDIENQLLKMLKDDKNIDYKDQIYFALGNLSYKEGNIPKAITYYRKSISESTTNIDQKTKSYLTLANIFYDVPDYVQAQAYYDSTVVQLDVSYPDYDIIYAKSKNLTDLVKEINTVNFEDSVQRLAKLDKEELTKFIDKLIEDVRKQEEDKKKLENERMLNEQFGRSMASQNTGAANNPALGGKWYFYNETAKSLGYKEFRLKWGNRKLEDNWRRKSKAANAFSTSIQNNREEANEEAVEEPKAQLSNKTREYYLKDIPQNDSMLQASDMKIEQALFNMGQIYQNDLKDSEKAADAFKELAKRFPDSELVLQSYYNLYTLYKLQNNIALAELYKGKIIEKYPQSTYALILSNPDYIKQLEKEENKVKDYYASTYNSYLRKDFTTVISRCNYALANYPDDKLIPRFSFLKALCIGKTEDIKHFSESLYEIISRFPGSEVAENAKNIIIYIENRQPEIKEEKEKEIALQLYQPAANTVHYFVFVVPRRININQFIFNIINFNLDNFDEMNLRVENVELNGSHSLIVIKPFKDKNLSMDYYRKIMTEKEIYKDIDIENLDSFVITAGNLDILQKDKSTDRYLKFFSENY